MNGSVRLWKLCVQELIGYLDAIDADPDLEPVLGYVVRGLPDEGEIDHDAEPSLGWTGTINQAARQFRRFASALGWIAERRGQHDRLADRPERHPGELQMCPGKGNADDGDREGNCGDQMPQRQPPAGEQQPNDVPDNAEEGESN